MSQESQFIGLTADHFKAKRVRNSNIIQFEIAPNIKSQGN